MDGNLLTVQSSSFDALNNRYLLFVDRIFNLNGVIQGVHHVPSPSFLGGTGAFPDGASASGSEMVNAPELSSATSFTSPPTSSTFGDAVTFTVHVGGGGPTPTGDVTFSDTGVALAAVALDGSGNASYSTSALGYGVHEVRADYPGDSTHATSFAVVPFTVYAVGDTSIGGFAIRGIYSTTGDEGLTPQATLYAVSSLGATIAHAGQPGHAVLGHPQRGEDRDHGSGLAAV